MSNDEFKGLCWDAFKDEKMFIFLVVDLNVKMKKV